MNIKKKINKLLLALRTKGYIYKINVTQYYSEEKQKIINKYILWDTHPKEGEVFYSKVKLLEYLIELYKKVGVNDG